MHIPKILILAFLVLENYLKIPSREWHPITPLSMSYEWSLCLGSIIF